MNRLYLLADDDNDDAELFREALAALTPKVDLHHVENGREVFVYLSNYENPRPDIIFLDLNMPEMSGWQCLAKLKNDPKFKDIPVLMYSTSSHQRDKEIAVELGAVGFITKPTDFKILKKILVNIAANPNQDLKKSIKEMYN